MYEVSTTPSTTFHLFGTLPAAHGESEQIFRPTRPQNKMRAHNCVAFSTFATSFFHLFGGLLRDVSGDWLELKLRCSSEQRLDVRQVVFAQVEDNCV